MSDCCKGPTDEAPFEDQIIHVSEGIDRRAFLKRVAGVAGGAALLAALPACSSTNDDDQIKLAFCSQLLCVIPYEVTRAAGFFAEQGLNVKLIYSRGGGAALQALNAGQVQYAATSLDAAINAFSHGANITRFATTGQLPLFAFVVGPKARTSITSLTDLKGKTVGVSALGNADHALTLFLLKQNGIDPKDVQFATLGTNLYDAIRIGQVDAGMVQEPALTLLEQQHAKVLINLMDIDDANKYLGGPYTFMGVSVRPDDLQKRHQQMQKMAKALVNGLDYLKSAPVADIMEALPDALVAGGNFKVLSEAFAKHRDSLYPSRVNINRKASMRVMKTHLLAGIQDKPVDMDRLLSQSVLGA